MSIDVLIWSSLLAALVLAAFATVIVRTLMMSTVLLAVTSVVLTITLFVSGMEFAGVMELSVSVGLVTAILASAIALLKPAADDSETTARGNSRLVRYLPLPIIMLLLIAIILYFVGGMDIEMIKGVSESSTQTVLWQTRTLDIIGLTLLILAGVLGVAALLGRREEK